MTKYDKLWQVTSTYFCAGVYETYDGIISDAAPILKWIVNKRMFWFKEYSKSKNWSLKEIKNDPK